MRMKRRLSIIAAIAALAACGSATHWMLSRPCMNPRLNYAQRPPRELEYPNWVESFHGYADGGETGMTVIAWAKYRNLDGASDIRFPFVMGNCTAEAARATRDGGAQLTNLVTGTLEAQTIDVSGGSWAMECLPTGYAVPSTLEGTRWQYGCYCVNITTDTPLTLTVADTEIYIPATNGMVRNVQGASASRYVFVEPESAAANVRFGIAEMPLRQFIGAQCDGTAKDEQVISRESGGLDETWRMFALRARIDNGNMIVRMEGYTPGVRLEGVQCVTQALWRARGTFEKDAMFRLNVVGWGVTENLGISLCMEKMFDGWITDEQVERIRDLDVAELVRHGATFPEMAEDFRLLRVTKSSSMISEDSTESLVTNAQSCTVSSTHRQYQASATAEVIHGVNYAGKFGPADYVFTCPGATVDGNSITFPGPGDYTVRATDPVGGFLTNLVHASGSSYTTQEIVYTQDGGTAAAFNGAVAGALATATNDGREYAYISGTATNKYYKWHARRLWPVPSACASTQGHYAKHAISPHVVASALHYWYWPQSALTYTDAQGNTATVTPGSAIRADQWARSHGFTEAEITAADLGDLVLFVVDGAIPDGCCPYLMSAETWRRVVPGPFGVLGWRATQTDLGWGLPVLFDSDIGNPGSGRASKWTWSRSFPYPTKAYSWTSASGLMASNHAYGSIAANTCAPTYGGDSGHPLYLEDGDGNLILISQHHTVGSGTCFPRAFEIIRAFCTAQGDTIKEWTVD